jgi:hypothetical protein
VAWACLSSTVFCNSGSLSLSLELVLWYCNNFYSNSVLFEVKNVVTSLIGLIIVSHLSPKGSGRLNVEGLQTFNSSILDFSMTFSSLRQEIESLQTFKSLVLEIKLVFSVLRLEIVSFNLSILAFKLAFSFLRLVIESWHLLAP